MSTYYFNLTPSEIWGRIQWIVLKNGADETIEKKIIQMSYHMIEFTFRRCCYEKAIFRMKMYDVRGVFAEDTWANCPVALASQKTLSSNASFP